MSQLQGIEQKETIKRVTGKITKLWEPKTFNGPKGEFTIQGGAIDVDGQEYGLKFFENNQNASILEGKVVTLSSVRGKHGFTGVTMDHESFSKKDGTKVDRDVIKVTKTGKVELGEADEIPMGDAPAPKKVIVNDKDPGAALEDIVKTHLYVDSLVRVAYKDKGYDEETLRSYVSSVFIEANRKGISYALASEPPKPACDPKDWGAAIVPSGSMKGKTLGSVGKPALTKLYQHYLEKGFDCPFSKCVEQAGIDLQLDGPLEEQDDIPW